MSKVDRTALPQWTTTGTQTGVDPLGMQNSSVRIYQRLLPGISNVTLRIRYYGFYVWLADSYAKDIGKTDASIWQRRIRRAEALYALVAQVKGGEKGVAGAKWASNRLATIDESELDFSEDTEPGGETHYLQNPWGVFGQAYQSQLFAVGLLAQAPGHHIPTPAPGVGDGLAEAFSSSTGQGGELFLRALDRGRTSRKELEAMAGMTPSSIEVGKERDSYQTLLMPENAESGSPDDERCKTLKLVLHWSEVTGRKPAADDLRWSMYSGYVEGGRLWTLPEPLELHRLRWAVYQANEITHVALETLLAHLLSILESYPMGCPLEVLIAEAVSNVQGCLDVSPVTWGAFVDAYALPPDASSSMEATSEWSLTGYSRMTTRQHRMSSAEQCAAAVLTLAALQRRMATRKDQIGSELSDLDHEGFRSLATELAFLGQCADSGFENVLRRLFLDRVVRRHLWVAMRKLRYQGEYTFLIDTDDGLVRHRGTDGPVWTGPRLGNAISFLEDIDLLSPQGITARGRSALAAA